MRGGRGWWNFWIGIGVGLKRGVDLRRLKLLEIVGVTWLELEVELDYYLKWNNQNNFHIVLIV